MADQAELQQKYAAVGQAVTNFSDYGAKITGIYMNGDKLALKCDPSYSDFDLEANVAADSQPYTIKSGDTLSAVCQKFYGNANKYPEVAKANNVDANNIPVGHTIELPVIE